MLFFKHDDLVVEYFVNGISDDLKQIEASEVNLGKIGYLNDGPCKYFRNLVLCR